ncbi:MAG: ADP-forming succinate--CoA ligase subunit beta [Pseudomonadota bacterium]|nr:ADP-forming succinate--CoA ligase subunit beta [Pseudomonadota bacterium]
MNLHEYQAKKLFGRYQLPIPKNIVARNKAELLKAVQQFPDKKCVLKVQVHAGGRGKAGGVKLISSLDEAESFAVQWFRKTFKTYQTGEQGLPVNRVLAEAITDIDRELYLGATVDRNSRKIVFMASTEGGVDIEEVARTEPEKILKVSLDEALGAMPYQGRELAYQLGLEGKQVKQFTDIFIKLAKLFEENDLSLIEVNPLVTTQEGDLLCLDAKINIDNNALYRQKALAEINDETQTNGRELRASEWGLNFVALEGNIGCLVNGAGLAMATMDLIQYHGGKPANFLDVGGAAKQKNVAEAFKIILEDDDVDALLINIFGGIVRCDVIAEGILAAVAEVNIDVPVIVRLAGNNAEKGRDILTNSGLNIITANDFDEAAQMAVKAAKGQLTGA